MVAADGCTSVKSTSRLDNACSRLNHVTLAILISIGLVGCASEAAGSRSIALIAVLAAVCGLGIAYLVRARRRRQVRISDRVPRYFYF